METGFEDETDFIETKKSAPLGVSVKRLVMWFLGNIVIWILAYFWLANGNEYAENYSMFIVWIHFLCSLAVFSKETRKKLQDKGPSVNMNFNLVVDCIYGFVLATFGFYLLAGLYIVGSKFQNEAYTMDT